MGARIHTVSKHNHSLSSLRICQWDLSSGCPWTKTAVIVTLVLEDAADSGGTCMTGFRKCGPSEGAVKNSRLSWSGARTVWAEGIIPASSVLCPLHPAWSQDAKTAWS